MKLKGKKKRSWIDFFKKKKKKKTSLFIKTVKLYKASSSFSRDRYDSEAPI